MKRYLILTVAVLVVLTAAWAAFGQREGGGEGRRRGQNLTEEQRTRMREMRERWQNMSEEEREKARAEMRQRFGGRGRRMGREDQLKAIEDVEKQLASLKKGIQAQPTERPSFRDMSEEERNKFREQFTKAREERNKAFKAIITQIARLQGQRQPAEGEELLIINTAQLKSIQELAVKEKAKETAQRLERLGRPRMGFFGGGRSTRGGPPASSTTEAPRRRSTQ
ncbi:MAG: hypothetical protein ACYSR9_04645 [Planctomycetota bacterium]